MTLEEKRMMDEEALHEYEESLQSTENGQSQSWKDKPSTSRDNQHSIPEARLSSQVSYLCIQK